MAEEATTAQRQLFAKLAEYEEWVSVRTLAYDLCWTDDYTSRVAHRLMDRHGISARLELNRTDRYRELWRLARDCNGVLSPPAEDVTWLMHLTREPLIERQFGIERRSQWVIDCAVNVHILFEFQGISERYVTTKLIGSFPLTPRAALLKQRRQQPSGRKLFCLREFVPVHSDTLDDVGLQLMLADIEWSDVVTFSLGLPELLEAGEYNGPLLDLARSEIPSIASVDVVLVTADGKVVAARRSRHRDYYPQTWSLSYEEQLSRDPRRRTRQADANHFDAVVEGAWEEFHVTVLRESIRLASIHVCLPRYAAACLMIARCRETSAQLWSCWQQAIDKEEHDYVVTLEPELAALGPQFFHPNPAPECDESPVWHPTSRMRLLAFLSNRWGLGQTADFLHQWKATQT